MITLFFVLSLVAMVFCGLKSTKEGKNTNYDDDEWMNLAAIFAICAFVFFIWICVLICKLGTAYIIDQKIQMYQEENTAIEQSIDETVKNYMTYEATTYAEFKDEDAINLVSLFPELKSDTLVQKQIEVYVANNAKIKELKEKKINLGKVRFKLYFGRQRT